MSYSPRSTSILAAVILALTAAILITIPGLAAPMVGVPVQVTQPDGTLLDCYASGDEFYNWMHDANGYTILQDHATGWYVYADLVDGILVPTEYVPGMVDPEAAGLVPYLNLPAETIEELVSPARTAVREKMEAVTTPTIGMINNPVVLIRFSDESEFTATSSSYNTQLNSTVPGVNSLRNYYTEASYNQLTVISNIYPTPPGSTIISYQDSHPRAYYQPYNATTNPIGYLDSQRGLREHTLLRDAINHVKALGQFPAGTLLDGDNDGYIDSLTFVIGGSTTAWNTLLWPHAWVLFSYDVRIDGKRLYSYNVQIGSNLSVGVLAHELFHVLGGPDLYHYTDNGISPAGGWDVMQSTPNPPQHMGCYMKYKYGHWLTSIPVMTNPGNYSLNPLTSSTNNCFKITSPNSATEFFIVEYRRPGTSIFEASLPGTGMLVYRINPAFSGNASGPPDEVYIYRPGGTPSVNGNPNQANFSFDVGRTAINDTTNPSSFLTGGSAGGLDLCYIGFANSTISFKYKDCGPLIPPGSFSKSSPGNTASSLDSSTVLDWADSSGATSYDYCLDRGTPNSYCDSGWVTGLTSSQVSLSGSSYNSTFEWQVRANNDDGSTLANGGTYWTFSTLNPVRNDFIYLPTLKKAGTPPAAFGKTTPANTAESVSTSTTLDWADAGGAVSYEYCYDASVDGSCSGTWTSTGSTSQVTLSGLAISTLHEWQVRAISGDYATYADSGTLWRYTTSAWTIITSENFEGSFPQSGWIRSDGNGAANGEYFIGKRNCNVHNGSYSGWMVGGGANGSGLTCGSDAPVNSSSRFTFGPFSTIGATAGEFNFALYVHGELDAVIPHQYVYDYVYASVSSDNMSYRGTGWHEPASWQNISIDLSNKWCVSGAANCLNLPNVWVRIAFYSNASGQYPYGALLDDIEVRVCMSGTCDSSPSAIIGNPINSGPFQDFLRPFLPQEYQFPVQDIE